jgi:hypothetical protein
MRDGLPAVFHGQTKKYYRGNLAGDFVPPDLKVTRRSRALPQVLDDDIELDRDADDGVAPLAAAFEEHDDECMSDEVVEGDLEAELERVMDEMVSR